MSASYVTRPPSIAAVIRDPEAIAAPATVESRKVAPIQTFCCFPTAWYAAPTFVAAAGIFSDLGRRRRSTLRTSPRRSYASGREPDGIVTAPLALAVAPY